MPTIDHYVTPLKVPMTIDVFSRFPRVPGYKAELIKGEYTLAYQPRLSMARMKVAPRPAREIAGVAFERLDVRGAHESLAKLFMAALSTLPPMDTMAPTTRRHAADAEMKHTLNHGHGAVIASASFVAVESANKRAIGTLLGAAIVTTLQLRADEWPEDERPTPLVNLTWLFVAPAHQRRRIGTALLERVVNALADENVPWLVSHLAQDNVSSVMFHWRNGFELVSTNAKSA